MKKIFLFLTAFTAIAVTSCSSDDDSGSAKKLERMTINDGTAVNFDFTYNSSDRVTQIAKSGGGTSLNYTLAYDGALLTSITTTGDDTGLITFDYDSNDRLSEIEINGTANPVTYNNGTYTIGAIQYKLNSRGDFESVISGDSFTFGYNTSKKGGFNNSRGTLQLLGLILENDFLLYATHKPLENIIGAASDDFAFANIYTEDGYISSSTVTLGGEANSTATYIYEE